MFDLNVMFFRPEKISFCKNSCIMCFHTCINVDCCNEIKHVKAILVLCFVKSKLCVEIDRNVWPRSRNQLF